MVRLESGRLPSILTPGTRLGACEIRSTLGEGGMGPIPVDNALPIARQIAEALDAAQAGC